MSAQLRNAHKCSKCGELHRRKHRWCLACFRESVMGSASNADALCAPAPAPPPGFDERDLQNGRPLL